MTVPRRQQVPFLRIDDAKLLAAAIVGVFEVRGDERYEEVVTQSQHAVQTAELAQRSGASDELIVAALLHDIGHLLLHERERQAQAEGRDLRHEEVGARVLSAWYGPSVTEPIRHHVAAKRYLCAVDPGYHGGLSPASVKSLVAQGGPMDSAAAERFRSLPYAADAAALRRWDDLAKDPGRNGQDVSEYRDLLVRCATIPDGGP